MPGNERTPIQHLGGQRIVSMFREERTGLIVLTDGRRRPFARVAIAALYDGDGNFFDQDTILDLPPWEEK